jgi:SHS2 domain-containing protein
LQGNRVCEPYGVRDGEIGAAETPQTPTSPKTKPRPSRPTPSSARRGSIAAESDVAADDRQIDRADVGDRRGHSVEAIVHIDDVGDPHCTSVNWSSERVYRWVEHTGEFELWIEAPTEEAVFAEAPTAFAEVVAEDGGPSAERHEVEVELDADDREVLLAEWLNELVYLADAEQVVPEDVVLRERDGGRLSATLRGHRGEPRPLVKR